MLVVLIRQTWLTSRAGEYETSNIKCTTLRTASCNYSLDNMLLYSTNSLHPGTDRVTASSLLTDRMAHFLPVIGNHGAINPSRINGTVIANDWEKFIRQHSAKPICRQLQNFINLTMTRRVILI